MWSLHGMGGRIFVQLVQVTWPIWLSCPYMVKTLKKSSLLEPKGWGPWNLVYSIKYYQFCSNDDPWLTLTLFTARSKLLPCAFLWEHTFNSRFPRNYWSLWSESWHISQLNKYMKMYEYPRSRSVIDLCPRSLRFHEFQTFLLNPTGQSKPYFMWSSHGKGKLKFVQMVKVILPKWAPCPCMDLLLWNLFADVLETWYTALGTRVLQSSFKWWP